MSIARNFLGPRKIQVLIQEADPGETYERLLKVFNAVTRSARRLSNGYKGCIHGPKGCPIDAVIMCDWCIEQETG